MGLGVTGLIIRAFYLAVAGFLLSACLGNSVEDVTLSPQERCAEAAATYDASGHTLLDGALVVIACADAYPGA